MPAGGWAYEEIASTVARAAGRLSCGVSIKGKTFLLCIGAQKAGTTWLHQYLMQHPDVYMSPRKELHFFDVARGVTQESAMRRSWSARRAEAVRTEKTRRVERIDAHLSIVDDASYRGYFERLTPERARLFGECTPSYALLPEEQFRKMRQMFPAIRIVFILRDPVNRLLSQAGMGRRTGMTENDADFLEENLANPNWRARSRYETTINCLENVFAPEEVIYLFYETLFRQETIAALCARLGIAEYPADFAKVYAAAAHRVKAPGQTRDLIRSEFRPTYEFCRRKFGNALPAEWSAD